MSDKTQNLGLPWVFDPANDNLLDPKEFDRNATLGTIFTSDHLHVARIWRACGPDDESTLARYSYLVDAANGYRELRATLVLCAETLAKLPHVSEFKQERALLGTVESALNRHKHY